MTKREIQGKLEAIEARPLSRAERDALQRPLLVALRDATREEHLSATVRRDLAREIAR